MVGLMSSVLASLLVVVAVNPGKSQGEEPGQMAQVKAHLQLLGFEPEERGAVLGVRHPELPAFVIREYDHGLSMTSFFKGKEAARADRAGFLELVNRMNQTTTAVRCFLSDEGDLGLEAWLPGGYERQRFARFLDTWHSDLKAILTLDSEAAAKYLD